MPQANMPQANMLKAKRQLPAFIYSQPSESHHDNQYYSHQVLHFTTQLY